MEWQIFPLVVTAPGGEIDTSVAQRVERRPLLGDADRMVQRQHVTAGASRMCRVRAAI